MPYTLDVADENDQILEATLDGTVFYIGLHYNSEMDGYTISFQNSEREVLISGIAVVPNAPLLYRYRRDFMPAGEMVVVLYGEDREVRRDSFKNEMAFLMYVTESELEANGLLDVYGRL